MLLTSMQSCCWSELFIIKSFSFRHGVDLTLHSKTAEVGLPHSCVQIKLLVEEGKADVLMTGRSGATALGKVQKSHNVKIWPHHTLTSMFAGADQVACGRGESRCVDDRPLGRHSTR